MYCMTLCACGRNAREVMQNVTEIKLARKITACAIGVLQKMLLLQKLYKLPYLYAQKDILCLQHVHAVPKTQRSYGLKHNSIQSKRVSETTHLSDLYICLQTKLMGCIDFHIISAHVQSA